MRLLHLAGEDPIAVLKSLESDANFEFDAENIKLLAAALDWPMPEAKNTSILRTSDQSFVLLQDMVIVEKKINSFSKFPKVSLFFST